MGRGSWALEEEHKSGWIRILYRDPVRILYLRVSCIEFQFLKNIGLHCLLIKSLILLGNGDGHGLSPKISRNLYGQSNMDMFHKGIKQSENGDTLYGTRNDWKGGTQTGESICLKLHIIDANTLLYFTFRRMSPLLKKIVSSFFYFFHFFFFQMEKVPLSHGPLYIPKPLHRSVESQHWKQFFRLINSRLAGLGWINTVEQCPLVAFLEPGQCII